MTNSHQDLQQHHQHHHIINRSKICCKINKELILPVWIKADISVPCTDWNWTGGSGVRCITRVCLKQRGPPSLTTLHLAGKALAPGWSSWARAERSTLHCFPRSSLSWLVEVGWDGICLSRATVVHFRSPLHSSLVCKSLHYRLATLASMCTWSACIETVHM